MASGEIHVNDIGTAFRLTVKDEENRVVDISTATQKTLLFRKPSGSVLEKTASYTTDGVDGQMQYVSASGDLDEEGRWKFQGFIAVSGGSWHTDIHPFKVFDNLR